jgi:hypothetical protein
MDRKMKFKITYIVAAFLFSLTCAHAFELMEIDAEEGIYGVGMVLKGWETHEQTLHLVTGVTPTGLTDIQWETAISDSLNTWSAIDNATISLAKGDDITLTNPQNLESYLKYFPDGYEAVGPPTDTGTYKTITAIDDWAATGFGSDTLAVCSVWFTREDRYFTFSQIWVNDQLDGASWTVGAAADSYDIQSVMTHELGHFIGLDHPYDEGRETSTMYYVTGMNTAEGASLEQDDMNGAIYLYPAEMSLVTSP